MKQQFDADKVARKSVSYREKKKLNQREFAVQLNTGRGVIGAMERGKIRSRRVAQLVLDLEKGR